MTRKLWDRPMGDDSWQDLNDEVTAFMLASVIENGGVGKVEGPFVGLGAGGAKAELSLARKFGINDITLVDNYPVEIPGFSGMYVEGNIFDFMARTEKQYGLLTMIGLDYVLEHRRNWQMAWNGIEKIAKPNAVIVMFPDQKFKIPFEGYRVLSDAGCLIAQRLE